MSKFTKLLSCTAAVFALASVAPQASAALTNVGGVALDPDYTDGGEYDFISQFNFTQWYNTSAAANGAQVAASYDTASQIGAVLASQTGSSAASGFYLQGTGEFYRVNGLSTANGQDFAYGGELTFVFGGIGLNQNGTFDISAAWARVYIDSTADYTHPLSNAAEVNGATDGNVWLELQFDSLSFVTGGVQNGQVSAEFTIIGGLAANNFDPKTLEYTADAFFTQSLNQQYSTGGNGSAVGNTVPEPGSLALAGLGLLGLGALRRRKSA